MRDPDQVTAKAASRECAVLIWLAQGHGAGILSTRRRPLRTSRPAMLNSRSRSRFGSAMRAHPVNAKR